MMHAHSVLQNELDPDFLCSSTPPQIAQSFLLVEYQHDNGKTLALRSFNDDLKEARIHGRISKTQPH